MILHVVFRGILLQVRAADYRRRRHESTDGSKLTGKQIFPICACLNAFPLFSIEPMGQGASSWEETPCVES